MEVLISFNNEIICFPLVQSIYGLLSVCFFLFSSGYVARSVNMYVSILYVWAHNEILMKRTFSG